MGNQERNEKTTATGTIVVTLADAPTDVLAHLVNTGCGETVAQIAAAVAPEDAHMPVTTTRSALALLADIGYATRSGGSHWYPTDAGRAAVAGSLGAAS